MPRFNNIWSRSIGVKCNNIGTVDVGKEIVSWTDVRCIVVMVVIMIMAFMPTTIVVLMGHLLSDFFGLLR